MQKALLRQLRRSVGVDDAAGLSHLLETARQAATDAPPEVRSLLEGFGDLLQRVDATYEQYERDVALRTRSLELSSTELSGANDKLRSELESRERALDSLREILHGLLPQDSGVSRFGGNDLESLSQLLVDILQEREESRRALDNQKFALDQHAIVSITDTAGTIVYANEKFCEISGYGRHELLGQNHRIVKSGVHPAAFFSDLWGTITLGHVWHGEVCNKARDGRLYWVNATIVPLLDGDGQPRQYIAIRTDITDRKMTEANLKEQLDFVEKLLDAIPVPLYMKDTAGRYFKLNKAFEELLHIRRENFIGQTIHQLLPAADAAMHAIQDSELFAHPGTQSYEAKVHARDGRIYDTIYRKTSLTRADGSVSGLLGTIIDITERKAAEIALQQAKNAAEAANQAKSEFLANMSHEIRTPMNGIIGMTDLALDSPLNDEQREYLSIVRSSAGALLTLINDILDFSKIEAGKLLVEHIAFDLHLLLAETLKPLALRAREKGLETSCVVAPEVPTHVQGDPGRLRQILVNLLGNAIKFTDHGEIALLATVDSRHNDRLTLHLAVRDSGIGIAPEKQAQIFEAFTQEDSSTTRRYGGTGLGLSICSRLVALMGGRMWVDSEVGRGSTFHCTLELQAESAPGPDIDPVTVALRGRRVLVVDDNPGDRQSLLTMLRDWDLQPEPAANSAAALALLRSTDRPFDGILLNANMPGMDGFQLADAIHALLPGGAAPPLLMLAGDAMRGDAQRCQAHGIAGYFPKPIAAQELLAALGRLFGLADRHQQTPPANHLVTRHSLREASRALDVLLVEDHPINQKLAISLLHKWGHRVSLAQHGQEALDMFAGGIFDVILMDMQMPVMGGIEATQAIRQREAAGGRPRTPIIAMTANAMQGDREACLAAGMDDYIAKPIKAKDLLALLATIGGPLETTEQPRPFDYGEALREADRETVDIIGALFLATWERDLQRLQAALQAGDAATAERTAHSLKGTLAIFCAHPASRLAGDMEARARDRDLNAWEIHVAQLNQEIGHLIPHLKAMIATAA